MGASQEPIPGHKNIYVIFDEGLEPIGERAGIAGRDIGKAGIVRRIAIALGEFFGIYAVVAVKGKKYLVSTEKLKLRNERALSRAAPGTCRKTSHISKTAHEDRS
ncbi:MAG: hypothetical protein JSR46_07590 [Verrucomicrobia bacterium]|nr:hypothetical protein [Verrucomicrobiota bacterium]